MFLIVLIIVAFCSFGYTLILQVNDKKFSAMYYGPAEHSHVSSYRMALTRFPLSLQRSKWSEVEKENLGKGIKQQFQETLLQISLDRFR